MYYVPDYFKTQKMCDDAVWGDAFFLQFVSDWFVTQVQLKLWLDKLIGWYEGYHKRQVQKAQIKKELLPIAWHPSKW